MIEYLYPTRNRLPFPQRRRNTDFIFIRETACKPYDGNDGCPPGRRDATAVRCAPTESLIPLARVLYLLTPGSRWPHMGRDDCKTVVAAHPPFWTSLISNMTARILRAGLRAPSLIRPMRNAKRRSLVPNSSTTPDATPPALGFEVALEPSRLVILR